MNISNSIPYKIYEVNNIADTEGFIYLGKTSLVDGGSTDRKIDGSNCLATFLFGSIRGGSNIRIDPATEKDPNIFIDTKFFDVKPYDFFISKEKGEYLELSNEIKDNNILTSVNPISSAADGYAIGDMVYIFKTISNNTSASHIIIESNTGSFYIGENGKKYYKQLDGSYSEIVVDTSDTEELILKSDIVKLQNHSKESNGVSLLAGKIFDDKTTTYLIKRILAGKCLKLEEYPNYLKLDFDPACAKKSRPCCDENNQIAIDECVLDLSSSSSSQSSQGDDCSLYAYFTIFPESGIPHVNKRLQLMGCQDGYCWWKEDIFTYHIEYGIEDFTPYLVKEGNYYRIQYEELDNNFQWIIRLIKYKHFYKNQPSLGSDEEQSESRSLSYDLEQDPLQNGEEWNLVRQQSDIMVLTKDITASNNFKYSQPFKLNNASLATEQPSGVYVYNYDLTIRWINELEVDYSYDSVSGTSESDQNNSSSSSTLDNNSSSSSFEFLEISDPNLVFTIGSSGADYKTFEDLSNIINNFEGFNLVNPYEIKINVKAFTNCAEWQSDSSVSNLSTVESVGLQTYSSSSSS